MKHGKWDNDIVTSQNMNDVNQQNHHILRHDEACPCFNSCTNFDLRANDRIGAVSRKIG